MRSAKETSATEHKDGMPPSDSSTMTEQTLNVCSTGSGNTSPPSNSNNNNNNNNNNCNTGGDNTRNDENNGPTKRQRTNSNEDEENDEVQTFTLKIPSNSNFIQGTEQNLSNISSAVKNEGGLFRLVPLADFSPAPVSITDISNFFRTPVVFKHFFV